MSDYYDVSRETSAMLVEFESLLLRWNEAINLIGRSTQLDIVQRHIRGSMLLWEIAGRSGRWLDMGSGGGLPGIPLAIVHRQKISMTLIDSDSRKCEFLRTVRRVLGLRIDIISDRIEKTSVLRSDVVVSRALAPLDHLLAYMDLHGRRDAVGVFPKGRMWNREVEAARRRWTFDLQTTPGQADPEAAILRVENVRLI